MQYHLPVVNLGKSNAARKTAAINGVDNTGKKAISGEFPLSYCKAQYTPTIKAMPASSMYKGLKTNYYWG